MEGFFLDLLSYFSLNGEIYKLLGVFQVIHKRKFLISIELSFRCIMPLIIENKCHENQNQKLALIIGIPFDYKEQ